MRCRNDTQYPVIARACPPCPREPWVILADVLRDNESAVKDINCFAHRRYVVSFADYYFLCTPRRITGGVAPADVLIDRSAAAGGPPATMLIGLRRGDGSNAYLPVDFAVQPGETLGALLAREGQREIVD